MELNILSFLGILLASNNLYYVEISIKYFLVQRISSIIFFLILIIMLSRKINFRFQFILFIVLIVKLGVAPFHY